MDPSKPLVANVLPKIVDVEWKLEVLTNNPVCSSSDNLMYTVILKTDDGKDVQFTCGTQDLNDLVYKLKDVLRHCENMKNNLS